jgi:glycine betaine/choline ABC-type transport system substrate-binding protein
MWKRFRVAIQTSDGKAFEAFTRAHSVQGALDTFKSYIGTNVTAVSASVADKQEEEKPSNPFREVNGGAAITDPMAVLNAAPAANAAQERPKNKGGRPRKATPNGQATDRA